MTKIKDENNKDMTQAKLALRFKVSPRTINKWINNEGITTLAGLRERNLVKGVRTVNPLNPPKNSIFFVTDDNNREIYVPEVARLVGLNKEVARDYIARVGVKTLAGMFERKEFLKGNHRSQKKRTKVHETLIGSLTTRELYAVHPHKETVSVALLSGRLIRRDSMCPSLLWPKLTQSEFRRRLVREELEDSYRGASDDSEIVKIFPFRGRTKHCIKDHQPCKHYRECGDHREFHGCHSPRYKKSGCFVGTEIKAGGTDGTKMCVNRDNRCMGGK